VKQFIALSSIVCPDQAPNYHAPVAAGEKVVLEEGDPAFAAIKAQRGYFSLIGSIIRLCDAASLLKARRAACHRLHLRNDG